MFKDIFLFLSCFPLSSFSPVVSLFSLHLHLVYICLFLTALPHREFFLSVSCPLSHVKTLSLWDENKAMAQRSEDMLLIYII